MQNAMRVSPDLLHHRLALANKRYTAWEDEALALLSGCLSLTASGRSAERYRGPLLHLIDAIHTELASLHGLGTLADGSAAEADLEALRNKLLRFAKDLISALPRELPAVR